MLSGLIVVGYRTSIAFLETRRADFMAHFNRSLPAVIIWLVSAAAAGLLVAFLVKAAPYIKGSGIPQVKASLMRRIKLDWKKELPAKFVGGSLALGVGFSLGREGPSIQLGALTGEAISDLVDRRISAAFNAPLAGVLFCIEELHKNVSPTILTSSLIASFSANAVMWLFYGNSPVFDIVLAQALPLNLYFSSILFTGILTGLFGRLFNGGILVFQVGYKRVVANQTARTVSAFVVVAGISLGLPVLTGGGDRLIGLVEQAQFSLWAIAALLAGKMVFTLFSYASGAPGGIFLPMLAIGALIGALAHGLLGFLGGPSEYLQNYILIGMVGFFTAVVRAAHHRDGRQFCPLSRVHFCLGHRITGFRACGQQTHLRLPARPNRT